MSLRDDEDDEHRPVWQRCPKCRKGFQVLADEAGQHPCPHCGYHYGVDTEDDDPEDDPDLDPDDY